MEIVWLNRDDLADPVRGFLARWGRFTALCYRATPDYRALLAKPVVALEGLDLRGVDPGDYELLCLPVRMEDGSDGASTRAVLRDL